MESATGSGRRARQIASDVDDGNVAASRYATDAEDNHFIETLVQVVEQCVVYSTLQDQERSTYRELLTTQLQLDNLRDEEAAYDNLDEPALEPLIRKTETRIEHQTAQLDDREQAHKRATELVRECAARRQRLLNILYGVGKGSYSAQFWARCTASLFSSPHDSTGVS